MKNVGVFCGSSLGSRPEYAQATQHLAAISAHNGCGVVCGGPAVGLMGALAESCDAEGVPITGVLPRFLTALEPASKHLTELVLVDTMHQRKERMLELVEAVFVLPGGFGTLDEAFELLTWRQLGLHEKPVIFINISDYWKPLVRAVSSMRDHGMVVLEGRDHFQVVDSVQEAFDRVAGRL